MSKRRKPVPVITAVQREILEQWARRPTSAQALALRTRMVLRLGEGHSSTAVAQQLRIHLQMESKWRERFMERGMDGLLDEPRPGQPRKISDAQVEAVLTRILESQPAAATHWSTRSMAQVSGLNQTAVSRIWRAFALQPHRSESFKLSRDPLFIDKQIRRGSFRSTQELETAIRIFLDHHNNQPKPFVWTKSADAILDSVARYCKRINDSGH